jgi:sugar/nucleoside kinase (ribokinase family)
VPDVVADGADECADALVGLLRDATQYGYLPLMDIQAFVGELEALLAEAGLFEQRGGNFLEPVDSLHVVYWCSFRCFNSIGPAMTDRLATIKAMSVVVVGSVAYDAIETPFGKRGRILGGAATYIALSASYFTKVGIVAVVGDDFDPADRRLLAERDIDLRGLEQAPGKTFFWSGVYSPDMNDRTTLQTDLNVFATFQPKLPDGYAGEPYLLLGNIQPALQHGVLQQMKQLRFAGGDTMNYWIKDYREELLETIRDWDFLLINDSEARMLAGESNLRKAAAKILSMGPNTLVIKRGEYGAMLFRDDTLFMLPSYLLEEVHDPTGAGDCFAGGFVGCLAERGFDLRNGKINVHDLHRAVVYGSVLGSFCCEEFGVERFHTLTRREIDQRFDEFRRFTAF